MSFFPTDGGGLFKQGAFQIDQNSTPEMLARKREAIAAMMPQYGKAKYVGEGIGQLATGVIAGQKRRAMDTFEGERRQEASGQFNGLMTGGGDMSSGFSVLGQAPSAGGQPQAPQSSPTPQGAQSIRDGLLSRGLPEHIADAFIMNFQDESGLDSSINETSPLVEGSRGGFGLAQWTGPRRRELEAFAEQRGVPVSDVDLQMDFLMTELQGSESRAAQSIMSAPDAGSAAAAIVNKFLRPAESHRASRVAKYTGGAQAPAQQAPQQSGQLNDLLLAAQNQWLSPRQKQMIDTQIQQIQGQEQALQKRQFEQQDPMYQVKLQQAQLNLEQDQNGTGAPTGTFGNLHSQAAAAGLEVGTPEYQNFMLNGGGDPATFRALDRQASAAGFTQGTPEYREFMATRGAGFAAGASQTAKNTANIATGGEAAAVIAQGTADGKARASSGSELREMERNMPGLLTVADQLSALADTATYTKAGQLRDEARKQAGLEPTEGAVARAEYIAVVDNQVLPLLRQTFGAAFTAKEGETLKNTLGDPNKSPAEKKAVLNAFIEQKKRDLGARGGTVPEQAGQTDFTQMDIGSMNQVDIMTLDSAGMDAFEARLKELGY